MPRSFYRRPAPLVARDLLGCLLVRRLPGVLLLARIVETEAYQEDDPASHSYRGLTPRTEVMFGPPGRLYVYFSYGNHWCMNVVTGRAGQGSAVLIRAAEPLEGLEWMRAARGVESPRDLCSGPGKLTQALGVTRALNGTDLISGEKLSVASGMPVAADRIGVGPRVGISVAIEQPWRFYERESPFVSRTALGSRPSRPTAQTRSRAKAKEKETGNGAATAKVRASARLRRRGVRRRRRGGGVDATSATAIRAAGAASRTSFDLAL
jgi:DNA-3-methyladenine glycosylase